MTELETEAPQSGLWQVTTETSTYVLDLDAKRVTRIPDSGAGPAEGRTAPPVASLRRDQEQIPLLELMSCAVGQPMVMLIDVRADGVVTLRTTTLVRHVQPLEISNPAR